MTRIEKVKQKAILDVAESLGILLNDYQGKSMNIQNTILLGFLRIPILSNGFHVTSKEM